MRDACSFLRCGLCCDVEGLVKSSILVASLCGFVEAYVLLAINVTVPEAELLLMDQGRTLFSREVEKGEVEFVVPLIV